MTARLWCGECRKKRKHRCNGIGMWICTTCGCYRNLPNAAVEARRKAVASDGLLAVRISALETCIKRILLENDRDGVRARFDHAREFLAANSAPSATQDGVGKDGGR